MVLIDKNTIKDKWLEVIKKDWLEAKDSFPDFLEEVSVDEKLRNEQYIQEITDNFQRQVTRYPRLPFHRKKWIKNTVAIIDNVLHNEAILGLHDALPSREIDEFYKEIKNFLKRVRTFSPEMTFYDIGQAIRNYIVYAVFKKIHRMKSGYSEAAFGYSMLYPFTDNYIDSTTLSEVQKQDYNKLIRHKLEGKLVHPKASHHRKTCDLLQAIEDSYSRAENSTIFSLLLMMLEAQEESLLQQKKGVGLSLEERLNISLYKGGVSVLIDRFLVNKEMTDADMKFYIGYGLFLQLADDLQDIGEDSRRSWQTLFTLDLSSAQEEKIVNQMLHFIQKLTKEYQAEDETFKNFILSNCYLLILTSLAGSKEYFSKEYLDKMEAYLPLTYSYYEQFQNNRIENKDIRIQKKHMKILDSLLSN